MCYVINAYLRYLTFFNGFSLNRFNSPIIIMDLKNKENTYIKYVKKKWPKRIPNRSAGNISSSFGKRPLKKCKISKRFAFN